MLGRVARATLSATLIAASSSPAFAAPLTQSSLAVNLPPAAPTSVDVAATRTVSDTRTPPERVEHVRLTQADVDSSNAKTLSAYNALAGMWSKEFTDARREFAVPRLMRYRQPIATRCGVIGPSNAAYCMADNTIYFDDVFVAAQAKTAGRALNSDGDMAGIGIIAHEMGHAVAMQMGFRSRRSYDNEAVADCLAGAFARQAQTDGLLEAGDLDEASFGMASAADPVFAPTGNARYDAVMSARLSRSAHGTREQRVGNFQIGLSSGSMACFAGTRQVS